MVQCSRSVNRVNKKNVKLIKLHVNLRKEDFTFVIYSSEENKASNEEDGTMLGAKEQQDG